MVVSSASGEHHKQLVIDSFLSKNFILCTMAMICFQILHMENHFSPQLCFEYVLMEETYLFRRCHFNAVISHSKFTF